MPKTRYCKDKKIIVLINALSARRGGGQTYLSHLLDRIDKVDNLDVVIIASETLKFKFNPRIKRLAAPLFTENPILRTLWEKYSLPKIIKDLHADVLFCPGGLINTRVPKNCCTVTMSQNMIPFTPSIRQQYPIGWQRLRNWLLERAMLRSLKQADLVIFISEYAKGVIQTCAGELSIKSVTIPHGISEHFKIGSGLEPPRPDWLPDGDYLLYVSIFEPYKNHIEVVRGFHRLKTLRLTHEKLVLAGKNDMPAGIAVREEIKRLGLQDDVILVGNIAYNDLPALYYHSKINIFASTCENCPNILLEALGAGRPLLISNIQPMPEFGADAVVYFDPFSPEDFAKQVMLIIDAPEELKRLGQLAAKHAEKYNWDDTTRSTWQVIRDIASKIVLDRSQSDGLI